MWNSDEVTPEELWLRVCCCYALGHMSVPDCLPYLEYSIDQTRFMKLLHEQRLVLLVYQVLSTDFKAHIMPGLMNALQKKANHILKQQLGLMHVSKELHQAFEQHNIPYVFLKGPALNQTLWGRRMMRYSGDLDVLISPGDIFKADAVLQKLNFKHDLSDRFLRLHQCFQGWSIRKDVVYRREGLVQTLELHWKTSATEFIFDSLEPVIKTNDLPLPQLVDDEHVLYLCLHAAKHGWSRMIWLVDIVALIEIKKLDITRLRRLAKARYITPVVDEALLLAELWLGVALLPHEDLIALKKHSKHVQERIVLGKDPGKDNWRRTIRKIYFMNAFCSSGWRQLLLWTQTILGAIIAKCFLYIRRETNA